ncbi:hypothetical protein [Capnocytophaga stomatis]|uniref:hypothetical protein n=1 Tax=Capnocytophaga stomatis TaxID=1848904 RepID=UPI001AD4604F|nr:hypothetical protein [Capnocytophaga stomatis]GIM49455.1 hypothetical protein CAPN003_09070 [Capnocytophaga stomatis]
MYYSKPKSSTNVLLIKISLFQRKLKDGKVSLFIEYYRGSEVSKDGKRRHLRKYENLKLYLHQNPTSKEEKKQNEETLQLAENILAIRKTEYIQGKFDIKNTSKAKRTFLNYFS